MTAQPRILGQMVSGEQLQADLARYCRLAEELGAAAAVAIPADLVDVDERVRLKCTVPRCLRAGETPNCPPYAPDLGLVRRALARFGQAVLFKCHVEPIEDYAPGSGKSGGDARRTLSFHKASGEIVYQLEKQAYADGYHLAMGFGGGSCKDYLCQGLLCQYLDSGRCRFPHRARPAMEAVGIDVVALLNKVGWQSFALLGELGEIPCAVTVGIVFVA